MRPITVRSKDYLFIGSDATGKSAAVARTNIEIAKMSNVNPEVWFTWVFERNQDHPQASYTISYRGHIRR